MITASAPRLMRQSVSSYRCEPVQTDLRALRPENSDILVHSEPDAVSGDFLSVILVPADRGSHSLTLLFGSPIVAVFALPKTESY